tara:strand:- start:830 stop:2161 length:1332 start_codon:yes stop_codon:yes gene_type:complete
MLFSNSPVKNIAEKLNPYSQKNKISRLKFERKSDYRTFLKFIKDNTKEVEDIKLPDEKKKTGLLAAGGLGLGLLAFAASRGGSGLKDGENVTANALEKAGMQTYKVDQNIKRKSNVKSGEDVLEIVAKRKSKLLENTRKNRIQRRKERLKRIGKKLEIRDDRRQKIGDDLLKEEKKFTKKINQKTKTRTATTQSGEQVPTVEDLSKGRKIKKQNIKPKIGADDTRDIVKSMTDRLNQIEFEKQLKNKFDPKAEAKVLDAQIDPDLKKLDRVNKGFDDLLDAINKSDKRKTRATIDRSKFFDAPEVPKKITPKQLTQFDKFNKLSNRILNSPAAKFTTFLGGMFSSPKLMILKSLMEPTPLADGTLEGKPGVGVNPEKLMLDNETSVNIFNLPEGGQSTIPFDANIKAPLVSKPEDLQTPTNNVFVDFEFDTTEDLFFMKMAGS